MYVAATVKNVRIDEFQSLKFDAIKPKLFENERPGKAHLFLFCLFTILVDFQMIITMRMFQKSMFESIFLKATPVHRRLSLFK